MFDNPGRKIQFFAKFVFWSEIIGGAITSISIAAEVGDYDAGLGFLVFCGILIGVGVIAYLTSLFLIAFGELVENSTIMAGDVLSRKKNNTTDAETIETQIREKVAPTPEPENSFEKIASTDISNSEKLYQFALARIAAGQKFDLEKAIENLKAIPGYKDADELLQQCEERLEMKIFR